MLEQLGQLNNGLMDETTTCMRKQMNRYSLKRHMNLKELIHFINNR